MKNAVELLCAILAVLALLIVGAYESQTSPPPNVLDAASEERG